MKMDNAQILDKAQGALIGSALGDAIGIFTGESCNIQKKTPL
jgi:ADP-ribosylglycohydrolase